MNTTLTKEPTNKILLKKTFIPYLKWGEHTMKSNILQFFDISSNVEKNKNKG